MKIYTRTGDDGTTGLVGAGRVAKHDGRVEAYGTVDELNATIGLARAADPAGPLDTELAAVQTSLFDVGAELATPDPSALQKSPRLADDDIARLEALIDRLDADLPPLTHFVLPAGSPLAAHLHLARTVCRRAERRVVGLTATQPVDGRIVRYLNRLADALFVMARWANARAGVGETQWRPRG